MRLTKQHFQLIAETIKSTTMTMRARRDLTNGFIEELRRTNPSFNADRFKEACGVSDVHA